MNLLLEIPLENIPESFHYDILDGCIEIPRILCEAKCRIVFI